MYFSIYNLLTAAADNVTDISIDNWGDDLLKVYHKRAVLSNI